MSDQRAEFEKHVEAVTRFVPDFRRGWFSDYADPETQRLWVLWQFVHDRGEEDRKDARRYRELIANHVGEDENGWMLIAFETSRRAEHHPKAERKQWFDSDIDDLLNNEEG